ncbi:hypothetical protein AQJ84_28840 [Streptomyces resistomycificus]|nr:hypothetical protein AQJ84_28840 [Streptomyces resistomycificus]
MVAIVAAVFSGVALKHSNASADAAKRSADSSDRSAAAAERSAVVDEATLAEIRRETEERRAAEEEAARPRPAFVVEASARQAWDGTQAPYRRYILRNTGTGPATNVRGMLPEQTGVSVNFPFGESLRPGEGYEFTVDEDGRFPPVIAIHLTWDGQDEPVAVPVPQ